MSGSMRFIKSAVLPKDYPPTDRPEVAVVGRSNAGKSSFLNAIAGGKVAKVSQTPGKTTLLNFFDYGPHYRFVDMPGYGFAARANDEISQWQNMIETYMSLRGTLVGLVLVMDIRRKWSHEEQHLVDFLQTIDKPCVILLTKIDKCSQKEIRELTAARKKESGQEFVLGISSQYKTGIKEAEQFIFEQWIKEHE